MTNVFLLLLVIDMLLLYLFVYLSIFSISPKLFKQLATCGCL